MSEKCEELKEGCVGDKLTDSWIRRSNKKLDELDHDWQEKFNELLDKSVKQVVYWQEKYDAMKDPKMTDYLDLINANHQLYKENEQLKEKCNRLKEQVDHLSQYAHCSMDYKDGYSHGGASVCQICFNNMIMEKDSEIEELKQKYNAVVKDNAKLKESVIYYENMLYCGTEENLQSEVIRLHKEIAELKRKVGDK
jgi:hypothetical protein